MTRAQAHSERLGPNSYLVRVGAPGEPWEYGQPYDASVVVEITDGVAEFKGLDSPLRPSQWRAIETAMRASGVEITEYWYERRKGAGTRIVRRKPRS